MVKQDESVQIYDFEPFFEGETFLGAELDLYINGSVHDFTGSKLFMQIRVRADSPVIAEELTSDDGDFTIANTVVTMTKRNSLLKHGTYVYSILEQLPTTSDKLQRWIGKVTVLDVATKLP